MSDNLAVEVRHLKKIFRSPGDRIGTTVLKDITFQVPRGSSVAITGENGSGKSTLIEAIAISRGFGPECGTRNVQFNTAHTVSELHKYIKTTLILGAGYSIYVLSDLIRVYSEV